MSHQKEYDLTYDSNRPTVYLYSSKSYLPRVGKTTRPIYITTISKLLRGWVTWVLVNSPLANLAVPNLSLNRLSGGLGLRLIHPSTRLIADQLSKA